VKLERVLHPTGKSVWLIMSHPSILLISLLVVLLSIFTSRQGTAQSTQTQTTEEAMFITYEQQPQFPGGQKALTRYLDQQVRYPKAAAKAGITGRVFASFVIDTVGRISQAAILRGLGYGCDEEAIRVVEQMPRWIPGRLYNRPVSVKYNLPILFSPK
jgi:periplasmic protein TonB